jgi:hypothetical protein
MKQWFEKITLSKDIFKKKKEWNEGMTWSGIL